MSESHKPIVVVDELPELTQMRDQAGAASQLLKSMGNQHRLFILCLLCTGELSVGEINQRINLAQSAISQHLAVLRRDDLVVTRKESQMVYYSLKSGVVEKIIRLLHAEFCDPLEKQVVTR
ncbi:MAG: metalloregulator ArsR/SmtB family transcription factor [Immundisolibacteraceae bacterium]|nr:metalloregulator ArsR/SmtB family transcription factor [Immundisolibacteraceae bacterium]